MEMIRNALKPEALEAARKMFEAAPAQEEESREARRRMKALAERAEVLRVLAGGSRD